MLSCLYMPMEVSRKLSDKRKKKTFLEDSSLRHVSNNGVIETLGVGEAMTDGRDANLD